MSSTGSRPIALRSVGHAETGLQMVQIYRRYSPYVAAVVLRLVGRGDVVEDLVQDVFVEASGALGRLEHAEAIKGWLATIAVRVCGRHLRRRRLRRWLGLREPAREDQLVDRKAANPVDRLLLTAVYRILDETPVRDRLAFCLHHLEGETVETVAGRLGCSPATAKRYIARVQSRIKEELGDG